MRGNSDMHYGPFTHYIINEEERELVHECLSLVEKKENIYKNDYSRGIKIRANIGYLIYEQFRVFKPLLMNSSMKLILALSSLVWVVKRY